jgi:hypothetical protein
MKPPSDSDAILVFPSQGEGDCAHCAAPLYQSAFVTFKNDTIACVKCGGLENLEFLPSGNTALTRRANALSAVKYVVLKFSRARKRYERQGILARPEILDQARRECAADEAADEAAGEAKRQASSARRDKQDAAHLAAFAARIRELDPSAPVGVEHEIAAHACRKHSHRVGRTAFAKELAPESIHLAVRAHIRHLVAARIEETTRRWLNP